QVFLLTDIGHKRHHRAVVCFDEPAHDDGCIKTTRIGQNNLLGHDVDQLVPLQRPIMEKTNKAFCACRRFSASSNTSERSLSNTSSVISSPRWAGRQCMTTAWLGASASNVALI